MSKSTLTPIMMLLALLLGGCATQKTKTYEAKDPYARIQEKSREKLKIYEDTVVLDARSSFEYGLGHWSEAIHFPWDKLAEDAQTGQLPKDPSRGARALSLLGVDPNTPVIVVGEGQKGNGEEGRLAWTLLYYGLTDVQTVAQGAVDIYLTQNPTQPQKNIPVWNRAPREDLIINKDDFIKKVMSSRQQGSKKVLFIDTRSKDEYFAKKGDAYKEPDIQALHIEWKEFYGQDGRADLAMKKKILSLGYSLNDEIIVFSNRGVRSAAAAYSLIANGFKNVRVLFPKS